MPHNAEDIVKNVLKVASLPQIYIKIDKLLNDPMSNNLELAKVIEEDPALTARLLRIANSAFYGFAAKVETVNHAISVLGNQQLRELVLACSVLSIFQEIPEDTISMSSFWQHSIACGVAARNIATHLHETNVERFFVAGLLHDIGRLIMFMELNKEMMNALTYASKQKVTLAKAEHDVIGFDHATIGGLLLKHWKLSPRLYEGITYHHTPFMADRYPLEASILHISDILVNSLRLGSSGNYYVPKLDEQSWNLLALSNDSLESIMENIYEQFKEATSFILEG